MDHRYWHLLELLFYYPHGMDYHMRIVHALHNIITVKSTFFDNNHLFVLRDLRCCKIADRFFLLPPSFKLFDNEAGYAAALILGMPSCLHVFRSHKAIGIITSALTLAGIVATDSRTAWIGALMILSYWCKRTFFQDFKFKRWHWCIASILSIIAISTLWMMRPESVLGRWYINKISTNLIETHPLTGLGHCGFHREYMNAQATYFMSHDANSSFGILADNILKFRI